MTKKNFDNGYDYNNRAPFGIERTELTEDQWYKLTGSKRFCMLPWMHMHAFPDGRTYPCCLADYWHPIGDLRKNTMREVWNQDGFKTLRTNMLNEQPSIQCTKCYEQEDNGFFSMRNEANRTYGKHINEVSNTNDDGSLDEFKIRYWDIRFSNLCNFRCRTCGPIFSSNWYNDHVKLYNTRPDVLGRPMDRVEYAAGDEDAMQAQMLEHVPYLEQVYFAGGEPLIMKEHYMLLEKLIEAGKTDIRLQYNTNFSELAFKDKHVFDYWKHFKNISIGASLDGSGARAELIRKGTDWKQTVENRERMMKEVPHVDFYISATVSSLNVLHVLDFHKEWSELGYIHPKDFNVNICQDSKWYRTDIFPKWFKDDYLTPAYQKHIEWLEPIDTLKRATTGFKSALNFINAVDNSDEWQRFLDETAKLDNVRNESFWDVCTEYQPLRP